MSNIAHQITAAMMDGTNPPPLLDAPPFDSLVHTKVGEVPIEYRRAMVLLHQMVCKQPPIESEERNTYFDDLAVGHQTIHHTIAELYDLKEGTEVVICKDWIVATVKQTVQQHGVNTLLHNKPNQVVVHDDTTSY